MAAHRHAEVMVMYAQDALETSRPWDRWRVRVNKRWHDLRENPQWISELEYQRKPRTSRERFEDWAHDDEDLESFSDSYRSPLTNAAWEAWKEAERRKEEELTENDEDH